jgi:PKD repeat protein
MLTLGLAMGQQDSVVNGVLQFSPRTFMVLPSNPQNPTANDWVKCWYVTSTPSYSYNEASWIQGINNANSNMATHRIYSANTDADLTTRDCFSCYQLPNTSSYLRNFKFPQLWNSDTVTGGVLRFERQYMQLFYPKYNGSGNNAQGQKIEYKFKVSDSLSVLLLNFSYVMQSPGHSWEENPYVDIRLLNANGQLLDIGYYPNDYLTNGNLHAGIAAYNNPNWPYSRFFVEAPAGSSYSQTPPAGQTPSTLNGPYGKVSLQTCPSGQIHQCESSYPDYSSDYYDVKSYPYTIVAFNLQRYIGQTVVLRLVAMGCGMSAHFAYCRFTAKMVPGELQVKYCGGAELDLSMPWGFDEEKYVWYNGADSAHVEWFDPSDVSDNRVLQGSTLYHPKLQPDPAKPYYRCETESKTGVPFSYQATVRYYDLKPSFTMEPKVQTSERHCDYGVVLHNSSKIGIIQPDGNGGVDTNWQDLELNPEQCTWDFGDGSPVVHGFEPEHIYTQPGTYHVSLYIEDYERICKSVTIDTTITLLPEYMEPQYASDTVSTCESKLPYYYKPELFGYDNVTTRWDLNAVGDRQVNYSSALDQYNIRSWNGCDSIVKVRFDVLTPTVTIHQRGDFCDSAQATLVANVNNVQQNAVEYTWTFMDSVMSTTDEMLAMSDGTYSVSIVDRSTECEAAATYKIEPCVPNIFLPNCITPTRSQNEGPVQNDYFYLDQFVLRFITDVKFMVYSRNGEEVFYYEGKKNVAGDFYPPTPYGNLPTEMDGRLVLWDGKVNGNVVSSTYVYTLWIVSGGKTYLYKGKLTVL